MAKTEAVLERMTKELEQEGYIVMKPDFKQCTASGKILSSKQPNFYRSYSPVYALDGLLPICKTKIDEQFKEYLKKFKGDEKLSIYRMCQDFNFPWIEECFSGALKEKTATHRAYIKNINSLKQYRSLTFSDSDPYEDKTDNEIAQCEDDYETSKVNLSKKARKTLVETWGAGFTDFQYNFLDNEFCKWTASYECNDYAMELIMQDLAWNSLQKYERRIKNEDVKELTTTGQKLKNDANLNPIQASGANASDQNSYGLFIDKIENTRPISDPSPFWADVDGVKKLIRVWFFGHLAYMMGVKNEFSQEYSDEVSKYTVEKEVEAEDDDESEDERALIEGEL